MFFDEKKLGKIPDKSQLACSAENNNTVEHRNSFSFHNTNCQHFTLVQTRFREKHVVIEISFD